MKILMLTPRFPYPPNRGDTVRSWSELEFLARRHDVWLASLNERRPPEADIDKLRRICGGVAVLTRSHWHALLRGAWSLLRGKSLNEGYFRNSDLEQVVRQWTRTVRFDAVLAFTTAMAPAAEMVHTRRVLDMCDVDSCKWEAYGWQSRSPLRWLYQLEGARLRRAERRWCRTHDATVIVNRRELGKLHAIAHPLCTEVLPTCVELPDDVSETLPREPIVGCIGSMFYPPNVRGANWFGQEVWPLVKRRVPAAQWWIVGQRPARSVRRWGSEPGVRVVGMVPDVRPYLDALRVFINPVTGDLGIQSKVLGAMAAGKACVVTPETAAGIDCDASAPFLIARRPEDFADAVARLLEDDKLTLDLARRGRETIARHYRPDSQMWQLERALSGDVTAKADAIRRLVPDDLPDSGGVHRSGERSVAEEVETRA